MNANKMVSTTESSDTSLCRLCGQENKFGTDLFSTEENRQNLCELINRYLPLKITNDDKYPKKICPGCNIQLEATKSFMDLIIEGQCKLRQLYKSYEIKENSVIDINSSIDMYTFQSDETGEKFFVQIISKEPLFTPEHELSLRMEGLDKPKRKRGRPPKQQMPTNKETEIIEHKVVESKTEEEPPILGEDGKRRRRIKIPTRYSEAIQGKEIDKVFKQEGVLDEESFSDEEMIDTIDSNLKNEEIIGRMEGENGEDLGQPILVNRNIHRMKMKTTKLNGAGLQSRRRRKYQCEICLKKFLHHGRYELHKKMHSVEFHCSNCDFVTKDFEILEQHHQEQNHSGFIAKEKVDQIGTLQLSPTTLQENLEENEERIDAIPEEETGMKDAANADNNEQITANVIENVKTDNKTQKKCFVCEKCNKAFSCKQNYEVHLKAVHDGTRPFACETCDKRFSYSNSLRLHQLQHKQKSSKNAYNCPQCSKSFRYPSSLQYHRDSEHANGRRFVCNKCNKPFKHRQLLQRHQLVHSDERPHRCNQCSSAFKTRANLLHHSRTVHAGQRSHLCQQCGKTFVLKTALKLHQRWHTGVRPYECDICKKSFSQKGNLAEHRRIHTGEKPYQCDHCGRAFTTSSQFRLHRKRHLDERPHKCDFCPKSFLHKVTLKCHIKRHFNVRPYRCQTCQKAFPEVWALKKHERLHTGEKPYKCEYCAKAFADSSNLAKHRRTHQNLKSKQLVYVTYQPDEEETMKETVVQYINESTDPLLESSQVINVGDNLEEYQPLQLQQLLDQDGNLISFTTADGQQFKVITSSSAEGQENLQGLLPDGTLIPINLAASSQEKTKSFAPIEDTFEKLGDVQLEGQLLDNNIQFLSDNQNMCLVTTYNIEDSINPQYLTMS